jgi:hypothetical protein
MGNGKNSLKDVETGDEEYTRQAQADMTAQES